jgi:RHS repeat-associated protein
VQDYVAGLEYRNGVLDAIYHPEGRIVPTGGNTYRHEYYMKDHLGNIRLTFADLNGNSVVDVPGDVLQENHFYAFGMEMNYNWLNNSSNNYKFNGIERNTDFGLNLDLAIFRAYDAAVGRWWQVDSRPNVRLSSYSGFANNPILLSDPLGDTTRVYTTNGRYVGTINDSKSNEEHFVSLKSKGIKGQQNLINKANMSSDAAENAANIVRKGSKYFIGANTRKDISNVSSASASEQGGKSRERFFAFAFSSKNKELRIHDLSSKITDRGSLHINPDQAEAAIADFIEENVKFSVVGWGHTHPGKKNATNMSLNNLHIPSEGDMNNLNLSNPIDGNTGNNPSMIVTRYGYRIYTTEPKYGEYEGGTGPHPIYNFKGIEIARTQTDD